jgi:competence protein ComEA
MSLTRKSDRATALLLLLLFLLSMYCLRQLLQLHGSSGVPSKEKHYVQIGENVGPAGIFIFSREPSLQEALAAAGIQSCDAESFGPQPFLTSGERLVVAREGGKAHLSRGEMNGFFKRTLGIPLSINTESEAGLTAIPNIGPDLARSIVQERSRRGGYKSLEELTTVPGIGNTRFLKIRPFLKL